MRWVLFMTVIFLLLITAMAQGCNCIIKNTDSVTPFNCGDELVDVKIKIHGFKPLFLFGRPTLQIGDYVSMDVEIYNKVNIVLWIKKIDYKIYDPDGNLWYEGEVTYEDDEKPLLPPKFENGNYSTSFTIPKALDKEGTYTVYVNIYYTESCWMGSGSAQFDVVSPKGMITNISITTAATAGSLALLAFAIYRYLMVK